MESQDNDRVRTQVRTAYAKVAKGTDDCRGCYGNHGSGSLATGYTQEDLASVPDGADLSLGCGNPQALAALRAGETVLDLGSGAGFDCFLAAKRVGRTGRVIDVDMTPEMVAKARDNVRRTEAINVEFRLGEIESLPVADGSVDVILSNCVINLSPDKAAVYRDAFRVLEPGEWLPYPCGRRPTARYRSNASQRPARTPPGPQMTPAFAQRATDRRPSSS